MNIETRKILYACYYPLFFVGLLWLIKIVEISLDLDLYIYGNFPLNLAHIDGILFQPLLHENFSHLWSNTIPLLFLIWALFYFYGDIALKVFPLLWIVSGILTWIIGRSSFHIGASGIVYGLVFFIFFSGVFRQIRHLMALSAIIAFLYGGIVWSMLPIIEILNPEMSWEGHLSGAISGIFLSIWFRHAPPQFVFPDIDAVSDDSEVEYWLESDESTNNSDTEE